MDQHRAPHRRRARARRSPTRLIKQDLEWEGDLVEAPTLVRDDDTYHLFFSANDYGSDAYAIGHATAPAVAGPWTKDEEPFLSSADLGGELHGPGGQDIVVVDDSAARFVFHAWDDGYLARRVHALSFEWRDGHPQVELPER